MIRDLLIRPQELPGASGETLVVTPEAIGFEYLTLRIRKMARGETFSGSTGGQELALVLLGGSFAVESPAGSWNHLGSRANVFSGMPTALYLPIQTEFTVTAEEDCEIAFCYCRAERKYPAQLIRPQDVEVEIRGGANATRQINHIIKPEFQAHRLLVVEVYTPSGNWSSYPPHKHDVHNPPGEVDLEDHRLSVGRLGDSSHHVIPTELRRNHRRGHRRQVGHRDRDWSGGRPVRGAIPGHGSQRMCTVRGRGRIPADRVG